jgi:hypothetical protein
MKLPQSGGCQCGKIRYEAAEPRLVYTCHCTEQFVSYLMRTREPDDHEEEDAEDE